MPRATHYLLWLFLIASSSLAEPVEVKRVILSPWSSQEKVLHYSSPVLKSVESILNHLGIYVDYFDIDNDPFPNVTAPGFSKKYLGVLTFFDSEAIPNGKKLIEWLKTYAGTKLPWIALGSFGFLDTGSPVELANLFSLFDLTYTAIDPKPLNFRVLSVNNAQMNFERKLVPRDYPPILAKTTARHWLKLATSANRPQSSAVFTSGRVSVAYGDYGLHTHAGKWRRQWQIDPFIFFSEALGLETNRPIPETAVINGRRVFFAHIDGDAFSSRSKHDETKYCSEVIEQEILESHSDLPFGVSLIAAEIEPAESGSPELMAIAKRVLGRKNVEPASHTYYHPLDWEGGKLSYGPRSGLDVTKEIVDSVSFVQRIAGEKPVNTIYWSGDCEPTIDAMKKLAEKGFLNINGGDSRFDSYWPSLSGLSPLGKSVGDFFQVFSGNANDNVYTNGWTGPYNGLSRARETFERTGRPRVLKPVNVYFHFFAGERKPGFEAVKELLTWARSQSLAPVFPTRYIRSVLAFRAAKILRHSGTRFQLTNATGLATLRLDATALVPDLSASQGVIGYRRIGESLYIHLSPNAKGDALISLAKHPRTQPYLESVGGAVENAVFEGKRVRVALAPFSRPPLILRGLGSRVAMVARGGTREAMKVERGSLSIDFPVSGETTQLDVSL